MGRSESSVARRLDRIRRRIRKLGYNARPLEPEHRAREICFTDLRQSDVEIGRQPRRVFGWMAGDSELRPKLRVQET